MCGVYDTSGSFCELYESDTRGCVGNFTASEDCCACGGSDINKKFCCNYVDYGDRQSSCDLFEGNLIKDQNMTEYAFDSTAYVFNYEDG